MDTLNSTTTQPETPPPLQNVPPSIQPPNSNAAPTTLQPWKKAVALALLLVLGVSAGISARLLFLPPAATTSLLEEVTIPGTGNTATQNGSEDRSAAELLLDEELQQRLKEQEESLSRNSAFAIEPAPPQTFLSDLLEPFSTPGKPCSLPNQYFCAGRVTDDSTDLSLRLITSSGEVDLNENVSYFIFGRMLAYEGALTEFYEEANRRQSEPQPYYKALLTIEKSAATHQLNPAFLYTLVDLIYREGRTHDYYLGNAARETLLTVDALASDLKKYFIDEEDFENVALAQMVQATDLSPSGKVMAYILYSHLRPELAQAILTQPGIIEEHYNQIFTRYFSGDFYQLTYSTEELDSDTFYQPGSTADFALCHRGRAYACQIQSNTMSCRLAPFLQFGCLKHLRDW